MQKIIRDKSKIIAHIKGGKTDFDFDFTDKIPDEFKKLNQFSHFTPSESNFYMLNQYIGNLWYDLDYVSQNLNRTIEDSLKIDAEASAQTDRIKILSDQLDEIDRFRLIYVEDNKEVVGPTFSIYTPLLLVTPYQYPKLSLLFSGIESIPGFEIVEQIFSAEQNIDYRTEFLPDSTSVEDNLKRLATLREMLQKRMHYLDRLAFLHASFTNSPILRLPLLGKSINKYISFFNPDRPLPDKAKIFKSINTFGNAFSQKALNEELREKIKDRSRQIVAIGDLPTEWLAIDGIPLAFTHDVTRMPEIPYGGLMGIYTKIQKIEFSIDQNILAKTLVVLGAPTTYGRNKQFDVNFKFIEQRSKDVGFATLRCTSVKQLADKVSELKPELIIFDTHGSTNRQTLSTELQLGEVWLTGNDIINYNIVAPLVILSACNTTPNWGYLNSIANAFFEAGCFSITGTYLPIEVFGGTVFYHRVLTNLGVACKNPIHPNWLNFMSHNIRSHYLHECFLDFLKKARQKVKDPEERDEVVEKARKVVAVNQTEAMSFSSRRHVYESAFRQFNSIDPRIKLKATAIPFEQLFYTNLGRGDLIQFESWLSTYRKTNLKNSMPG